MSNIYLYELKDLLTTVRLGSELFITAPDSDRKIIATITSTVEEMIEDAKHKVLERQANENEESTEWLEKNQQLGDWGEQVALSYYKSIYQEVNYVASQNYLGYDIEILSNGVFKEAIEVKTANNHQGFHISLNELKKTYELNNKYTVFFIKINQTTDSLQGFIINNPLKTLQIEYKTLIREYENDVINFMPNKFFIQLKNNLLNLLTKVELNKFLTDKELNFLREKSIK